MKAVATTFLLMLRPVFRLTMLGLVGLPLFLSAQQMSNEEFTEQSLKLRTALHYDSMLEQPLEALVALYENADRTEELVGLYRSHVEQYPDDAGAKVVLLRILKATERTGVGELIASSVALHPQFPALQYLLYQFLEEKGDERSVDALSRAIDLQTNPARRGEWLEDLLQQSNTENGRAAAAQQLARLLEAEGQTAAAYLSTAKLMQRYSFWNLSRDALRRALDGELPAESEIEAGILLARAEAESGNREDAGGILDGILKRLSADHWRRQEIITMRVSVIASEEERDAMLKEFEEAYGQNPTRETAALEYAEVLIASERQTAAASVLASAAPHFTPGSSAEVRALELIESIGDPGAFESFLTARLEEDPSRADLRFKLVKVQYALGRDAAAEQDFRVVIAALDREDASERILELQRYLRSIERIEAAGVYLEQYVRNHPSDLSVARELAEIYVSREKRSEVDVLVSRLDPKDASAESLRDLVEFLAAEEFFVSAKLLLGARLTAESPEFDLGLLQIVVLSELGDEKGTGALIAKIREQTDTPERYALWLEAAVTANQNLERLDQFFDSEQNRFSFTSDQWPEDKVEKFVMLCEAGRQRLLTDRVANSVREQLSGGTFDSSLRIRLRRFLVGLLEASPDAAAEVEEQLQLLAEEDPDNVVQYDLQRALVYHRTGRADLAQQLLLGMDLNGITEASLVQDAAEVLVAYGFLDEAETALQAVNRLIPDDIFSWEKRLTLLAVLKKEEDFRSVVRSLEDGSAGLDLREDSIEALDRHLAASYWRSISRLIATGDPRRFEEILPLLASVNRSSEDFQNRAWTEWCRAIVLRTLGRTEESDEAMGRLQERASSKEIGEIRFPDGMKLSLEGATQLLNPLSIEEPSGNANSLEFLSGVAQTRWAFEADYGARILRTGATGEVVLALDDRGVVYALDIKTGKLLWREQFGPDGGKGDSANRLFFQRAENGAPDGGAEEKAVKVARPFAVKGENFYLIHRGSLQCFAGASGDLIWSAEPGFAVSGSDGDPRAGAKPGLLLAVNETHAILSDPASGGVAAFDALTGKMLWRHRNTPEDGGDREAESSQDLAAGASSGKSLLSLNSGLAMNRGMLFVYGRDSLVMDLASGRVLWNLSGQSEMIFPVKLRKSRDLPDGPAPVVEVAGEEESEDDWQSGWQGADSRADQLIDFLSRRPENLTIPSLSGDGKRTGMVNPAVYWAEERLEKGHSAYAHLSGGYLWLMQEGKLKRISVRLPVASRELPAGGAFLGRVGNHTWFLDGKALRHLDFSYERVHLVDCSDLGDSLRAVLSGNQIVVRGQAGMKLVNAKTGRVIGASQWPEDLRNFLAQLREQERERQVPAKVDAVWQGEVRYSDDGSPNYCLPITDLVREDAYIVRFGENSLVCLARETEKPRTNEAEPPAESEE